MTVEEKRASPRSGAEMQDGTSHFIGSHGDTQDVAEARIDRAVELAGGFAGKGLGVDEVAALLRLHAPDLSGEVCDEIVAAVVRERDAGQGVGDPSNPAERQAMLDRLAKSFSIPLRDLAWLGGDSPKLRVTVGDQTTRAAPGRVTFQSDWERVVLATGHSPERVEKGEWRLCRYMIIRLARAKVVDPGPDGTRIGELAAWLDAEAGRLDGMFRDDDRRLYLDLTRFREHLRTIEGVSITRAELAQRLREAGAEHVRRRFGENENPVRRWRIPANLDPGERGGE